MKRLLFCFAALGAFANGIQAQDFTETVKAALAKTNETTLAVPGSEKGWYFFRKELEHLAIGDLATADLKAVNKEQTDPLPVIQKYADELKELGVELLLVPIPPKAAIYPEKLDAAIDPKTVPSLVPFYDKIRALGVEVLDLETVFNTQRVEQPDKQLYCGTDSHWSPYTCELVAQLVADKYKDVKEVKDTALSGLTALPAEPLEFQGDLLTDAEKATAGKETLPLSRAGKADGNAVTTVATDPNSAILVIGDSHLQVFRTGGNMLATQGGFIDHLQVDLAAAVHEISMQAGGADGPRREIARNTVSNPEFWVKKKVLVWVFTAREFTFGKWNPAIPVLVKKK